jgi:hypothetical protein
MMIYFHYLLQRSIYRVEFKGINTEVYKRIFQEALL